MKYVVLKDIAGLLFSFLILVSPNISDWWIILAVVFIYSSYKHNKNN